MGWFHVDCRIDGCVWLSGRRLFPKISSPALCTCSSHFSVDDKDVIQKNARSNPAGSMVGFQFWRIFGAVFFLVALEGAGPEELMMSGYGDLLTGTLAITALCHVEIRALTGKICRLDIHLGWHFRSLVILYILLSNYPIWRVSASFIRTCRQFSSHSDYRDCGTSSIDLSFADTTKNIRCQGKSSNKTDARMKKYFHSAFLDFLLQWKRIIIKSGFTNTSNLSTGG